MSLSICDDRQMHSLTGLSLSQFDILLEVFTRIYHQMQWQAYQDGLEAGTQQRQPGGGQKGGLPTLADKLMFVLYYFKVYPTFDVLGTPFNNDSLPG